MAELLHHRVPLIGLDTDVVLQHNLERQLFYPKDIGKAKGAALLTRGMIFKWKNLVFNSSLVPSDLADLPVSAIICCADNLKARRETLAWVDQHKIPCIIAGNETWTAEAYVYVPSWFGTKKDPRVYYDILRMENANRRASCAEGSRQTSMANAAAATFVAYLFDLYNNYSNWQQAPDNAMHYLRLDRNGWVSLAEIKHGKEKKARD